MSYSDEIIEKVKAKNPNEPEFIQAVTEVMNSLRLVVDNDPKYQNEALLERIVEPERIIMFRVPWVDDEGKVQVTHIIYSGNHCLRGHNLRGSFACGSSQEILCCRARRD